MLTFFGLAENYRSSVLTEIFFIITKTQGAFTHDEIYNMPVGRRRSYLGLLLQSLEPPVNNSNTKNTRSPSKFQRKKS